MTIHSIKPTSARARSRRVLAIALGAITPLAGGLATTHAQEFGSNTRAYEDDAWYDVSEWFDGNDYNPTDEAITRWDNKTFDVDDELTDNDSDNDIDWATNHYGYYADNKTSDSDWFYDYYDYGYTEYSDYDNNGYYDYAASYYDYDNDGVYDATAEFADKDSDGIYESNQYVGFADPNTDQDKQNKAKTQAEQKTRDSKIVSRSGTIKAAKKVRTPHGTNLVVVLNDTQNGSNVVVDLGSAKDYDTMPRIGQELTVEGTTFKAGDQSVLLASMAMRDGVEETINRSGRKFTGTVSDLKTMQVRGNTHQMAKITTDAGKKMLVDMGPQQNLKVDVKQGSTVSVTGPAVKVKDRLMLVAREVTLGGNTNEIKRTVQ